MGATAITAISDCSLLIKVQIWEQKTEITLTHEHNRNNKKNNNNNNYIILAMRISLVNGVAVSSFRS